VLKSVSAVQEATEASGQSSLTLRTQDNEQAFQLEDISVWNSMECKFLSEMEVGVSKGFPDNTAGLCRPLLSHTPVSRSHCATPQLRWKALFSSPTLMLIPHQVLPFLSLKIHLKTSPPSPLASSTPDAASTAGHSEVDLSPFSGGSQQDD
jgi:hypothetical protein